LLLGIWTAPGCFAHNSPFGLRHRLIAKLEARDAFIRESWVNAMETKLIGEELAKCRRGEGVNAYQNCKYLADLYLELLKDASVRTLAVSLC